jgi:hypothetical protein
VTRWVQARTRRRWRRRRRRRRGRRRRRRGRRRMGKRQRCEQERRGTIVLLVPVGLVQALLLLVVIVSC